MAVSTDLGAPAGQLADPLAADLLASPLVSPLTDGDGLAAAAAPAHRWLDRPADYEAVWLGMKAFTEARTPATADEIWLCEHAPVYTLGQAGLPQHVLAPGAIPVVRTDRGGQVTYHGPGQVVAYVLVDLRRAGLYVKEYVAFLEDAVIGLLADYGVAACRKPGAPGVYVPGADGELAKIAALGIKVRSGCTYHGVAVNVDMDLAPFDGINPCGYANLATTDLARCGVRLDLAEVGEQLARRLALVCNRADAVGQALDPA